MQKPVPKVENLAKLRGLVALQRPPSPLAKPFEEVNLTTVQGEFLQMAEKLGIVIPPEEPMVALPMCLLRAIVARLS